MKPYGHTNVNGLMRPSHFWFTPKQHPGVVRIWIALAGLTVTFLASSQSFDKRTRETYAANRISNQVTWDYIYAGNKPSEKGIKTSVTQYTPQGYAAQVTSYNPKGQVINIEKYQYDSRGNRTEYSRYQGEGQSQAAYQKFSKYNDNNLLVEESGYDGVENFMNLYKYDARGEMAEIRYMKKTVLNEKRTFTRDGSTTLVSIYNQSGSLVSKLVLKYDAAKNLTEESVYGMNHGELEKKTYNYDENRNLKEETKFMVDKITLKTIYNYNASGDLLDISEESPGNARFIKKSFTYGPKGNLLDIKWRRKGNEEFNSITYSYDAKGICTTADTWYPATKYRVLTKYKYDLF